MIGLWTPTKSDISAINIRKPWWISGCWFSPLKLVGGLDHSLFSHILGIIIPFIGLKPPTRKTLWIFPVHHVMSPNCWSRVVGFEPWRLWFLLNLLVFVVTQAVFTDYSGESTSVSIMAPFRSRDGGEWEIFWGTKRVMSMGFELDVDMFLHVFFFFVCVCVLVL